MSVDSQSILTKDTAKGKPCEDTGRERDVYKPIGQAMAESNLVHTLVQDFWTAKMEGKKILLFQLHIL